MYTRGQSFLIEMNCPEVSGDLTIEVVFGSDMLTETGKVANSDDIASLIDYLRNSASAILHRAIDGAVTEERIARHLNAWCQENLGPQLRECLIEVRVSEQSTTWAAYRVTS
jgi:hypothetical protein